jgi:hypothetical protein
MTCPPTLAGVEPMNAKSSIVIIASPALMCMPVPVLVGGVVCGADVVWSPLDVPAAWLSSPLDAAHP